MTKEKIATWYERYLILFNPQSDWGNIHNLHTCAEDSRFAYIRVPTEDAAKEIARHIGFRYISAPVFAHRISIACGLSKLVGRAPTLKSFRVVFKKLTEVPKK